MVINLILLAVSLILGGVAVYFKSKADKALRKSESSETSLFLYDVTFSDVSFNEKLKRISLAIMKRLSFDYVSFMILDAKGNVGVIESNIPEFDKQELIVFAKELLITKDNPQILYSENGFLPHGANRAVKYTYYIPLQESGQNIGAIILEKETLHEIDKIEGNVFTSIVSAVSRAFSFIIFAYNLTESAYKDVLTGTLNRAGLETIPNDLGEDKYSAVMCDIDLFKKVNDTYGHDAGDEVIKHLASTLLQNIRPNDAVFRMGGEEFLMLLKNVDSELIIRKINDIRRTIEENAIKYDGNDIKITASFGLCDTSMTNSLSELIKLSDKALYYSKNSGRNRATIYRDNLI
ncbi:MAG: GGDEF domain-containing protein [Clostridia bacterium]|nr:GGDEF domain-containing protein [Clostridia bacterium]